MTIKPQTTSNEIHRMIIACGNEGRFLDRANKQALDIFAEIDKLDTSDRDRGLELRAILLHVCGDLDGALNALDQRKNKDLIRNLTILSNYCRCEAAQEIYSKISMPRDGRFWSTTVFAHAIGAFRKVASLAREAERMKLINSNIEADSLTLEEIFMIDEVITELGISDMQAGRVMETAGRVLEKHGYLFLGLGPEIEIFGEKGESRSLHLTYRLAASSTEAVKIYMDFIEVLYHHDLNMPMGFHVSFGGSCA